MNTDHQHELRNCMLFGCKLIQTRCWLDFSDQTNFIC